VALWSLPFYIRAGKCLPLTCTEVLVRLRQPPTMYQVLDLKSNHYRMRISPNIEFAVCTNIISPTDELISIPNEIVGSRHPTANEMGPYERLLGDAMAGDTTLFAREDYIEEAWRIVDSVLKAGTPVYEYEPKTWGPKEAEQQVTPPGGWHNPVMNS
jgi:glucose-6-phosphate 1-dehydrogenase